MTVRLAEDGAIVLEGVCPIEDADRLLQFLRQDPAAVVDWRGCVAAHSCVIQILLAAKPALRGPPSSPFLRDWIEPALAAGAP